ncbi:MAG: hypothetical protein K2X63_07460 [Burkholderiaceae bacterium]|nr:hypothetical protein [Burkholderiaceae bacterium]
MAIESSDIVLAATHVATQQLNVTESVRATLNNRTNNNRPIFPALEIGGRDARQASVVQISDAAKIAQSQDSQSVQAAKDVGDANENDPKVQLIKSLVEFLLGIKIRLFHAADLNTSPAPSTPPVSTPATPNVPAASSTASNSSASTSIDISRHTAYTETEQTTFTASGVIHTTDNKDIRFDLSITLQRSYHEESDVSIHLDAAKKVDPLVLNFSANSAQLSAQQFAFDLNGDGQTENISFVQGAGFLALDKNSDGKINDGKELFGPATGNGFAELQQLDQDGNGWIDENDAAFKQLQVWIKDSAGADHLSSLTQAGVAALYLGNVSTPFAIKDAQNQQQAQLNATGLWLSDAGKVNTLQQVDLVV